MPIIRPVGSSEHVRPPEPPHGSPASRRGRLADLVALVRPTHAVKSIVVVPVALIDTRTWTVDAVTAVAWAILVFILAASCVYVINDVVDRHRDRLHPVKRQRPIAAGRIPVAVGVVCSAVLVTVFVAAVSIGPGWAWPVLLYLVLNVAYCRVLKHIAVIDVCSVALGFVLRVVQGYVVIGAPAPGWLLVAVFSVTLMVSIGKRRQELVETETVHRPALGGYTLELANHMLQITGMLAVVSGLLYLRTAAPFGEGTMVFSVPFLLFVLFRYLQLTLVIGGVGDPVRVLTRDRAILVAIFLWLVALGVSLVIADASFLVDAVSE